MWHIFRDSSDGKYIVMHFDSNGMSDKILRNSGYDLWVDDILVYANIDIDTNPEHIDKYTPQLSIIHSFDSDDPISYIQSLPQTHPELFI